MRNTRKVSLLMVLAIAASIWGAPQPDTTGVFTGTVADSATGTALAGARVILSKYLISGSILDSVRTDASGNYIFDSVVTGRNNKYTISINLTGYAAASATYLMLTAGQRDTVDFLLVPGDTSVVPVGDSGSIAGVVEDSLSSTALENALVLLSQGTGYSGILIDSARTGSNGRYYFDSLAFGIKYTVSVSAAGYMPKSNGSIMLSSLIPADTIDFTLVQMDTSDSWVVTGAITADSTGGAPIESAQVLFVQRTGTENRYSAITGIDGNYSLLVPALALTYTVTVSGSGFFTKQTQRQIAADSSDVSMFLVTDTIATLPEGASGPETANLLSVYPNPFNGSATVSFATSGMQSIHLAVYGIDGKLVTMLADGTRQQGQHVAVWNTAKVPSGVYFVQYRSGNQTVVRKLMLRK